MGVCVCYNRSGRPALRRPKYLYFKTGNKSVRITHEELTAYDADVILVAPCGMDRVRAKSDGTMMWRFAWWRDLRAVKNGQVHTVAVAVQNPIFFALFLLVELL